MKKIDRQKLSIFYHEYKRGAGFGNFGDVLTPLIVKEYFNIESKWSPRYRCDLIAIGSILDRFAVGSFTIGSIKQQLKKVRRFKVLDVWGAGMMFEKDVSFPKYMKFHAVRGKLTQRQVGERAKYAALGDPGLLADRLLKPTPEKKYSIAFIPHYTDYSNPRFKELCGQFENSVIINVYDYPLEIISIIAASEVVISTSMHGLVVADSLGIPNIWAEISDNVEGSGYKFRDYYSVFDIVTPIPIDLNQSFDNKDITKIINDYSRPKLEKIKEDLIKSIPYQ